MSLLWRVALTTRAKQDVEEITDWTEDKFGRVQALTYAAIIAVTVRELENGPDPIGVRNHDDVLPGLRLVHVARHGRHGRHFVLFRIIPDAERTIEVLRILYDQMDLVRRLPTP